MTVTTLKPKPFHLFAVVLLSVHLFYDRLLIFQLVYIPSYGHTYTIHNAYRTDTPVRKTHSVADEDKSIPGIIKNKNCAYRSWVFGIIVLI